MGARELRLFYFIFIFFTRAASKSLDQSPPSLEVDVEKSNKLLPILSVSALQVCH